jgi:hypothetical protein
VSASPLGRPRSSLSRSERLPSIFSLSFRLCFRPSRRFVGAFLLSLLVFFFSGRLRSTRFDEDDEDDASEHERESSSSQL